MGITRFLGPVYGAKANLVTFFFPAAGNSSNGGTTAVIGVNANGAITVPPYEDWFVTEGFLTVSTKSSVAGAVAIYVKSEGGSSGLPARSWNGGGSTNAQTIFSFVEGTTSTSWSTWATATPTAGEYEGAWVPAGSTIRCVSSGTSLPGNITLNLRGYTRYVDSTRAV